MALPSLDKTWLYDVNIDLNTSSSATTDHQKLMRRIKTAMISFASNAWTVVMSSDGTNADSTDRWTADNKLVWGTGNHSWIVLKQAGISTNFQILIDLSSASLDTCTIKMSVNAGFTGGSISTAPTATDSVTIVSAAAWTQLGTAGTGDFALHVMQSSDGECTRVFIYQTNVCTTYATFCKAKNPVSGWTYPGYAGWITSGTNACSVSTLVASGATGMRGYVTASMTLFMTCEGYNSSTVAQQQTAVNDLDSNWPILPLGVASNTASHRGRHGQVFDLWLGSTATADGDTYPNDSTRTFVTFGDLVVPWNGTVPLLS